VGLAFVTRSASHQAGVVSARYPPRHATSSPRLANRMADCDKSMRQTQTIDMLGTARLGTRCAIVKALASATSRVMSHLEALLKHSTPYIVNATQQRACMTLLFLHHKRLLILQAPASSPATPRRRTEHLSCHLQAFVHRLPCRHFRSRCGKLSPPGPL